MKKLLRLLLVVAISFLFGCVPNRKYVYLQKDDLRKKSLPIDTVVRQYELDTFDYRIQSNDILSVRFESMTPEKYDFLAQAGTGNAMNQLANALIIGELVDEKGEIAFREIGKVKVAGFTVFQVQEKLQSLANQYLDGPVVKVRLLNYRFTILGEANKEGTIVLNNNRVSMLEAIGQAGGLTDLADRKNVKLLRQREGKTEVLYLNLLDENLMNSPYFYVYQNDVIIVPSLRQRPFRRYFGQNLSLLVSTISLLLLAINLSQ